jgi:hypothetical protein
MDSFVKAGGHGNKESGITEKIFPLNFLDS